MPGSAIGRITRKDTVSRPNQECLWIAKATIEPSTSAMAVAPSPALTEFHSASRMPVFSSAFAHQSSV